VVYSRKSKLNNGVVHRVDLNPVCRTMQVIYLCGSKLKKYAINGGELDGGKPERVGEE